MNTIGEQIIIKRGLPPQAVNNATSVSGDAIDRLGFDHCVASLVTAEYTASGTTKNLVDVKVQESDTVEDGDFSDIAGATGTVERIAKQMEAVFDIDLETSNTIDLKIDGVSMTQVPFNGTHAQTMADIATQMNSDFSHITTTVSGRTITMLADVADTDFIISDIVVAAGTNQAVATIATSVEKSGSSEGEIDLNLIPIKRYIRMVITVTFTDGGSALLLSGVIALGNAKIKPVV